MLRWLLSRFAGLNFLHPLFRFAWVQRTVRLLFGGVTFRADIPAYGFGLVFDVFNVRAYNEIRKEGAYETATSKLFAERLKPGMTVLDVGANIGYYTLLAAKSIGNGKVYAAEPDPACIDLLKKNLALNRVTNVDILPVCFSDSEGDALLYRTLIASCNSLVPNNILAESHAMQARQTRIDTAMNGKTIDIIKIDIQGAELKALRGAEKTLTANPGIELFIEFWPYGLKNAGDRPEELLLLLLRHGFVIDAIEFPFPVRNEQDADALVGKLTAMENGHPYPAYANLHAYRTG